MPASSGDERFRQRLRRLRRPAWLGTIRRTTPLSYRWGFDRGTPIDRYYIECFLAAHSNDIHGRALEVMDNRYTTRFGAGVTSNDVLDVDSGNDRATVVGDLSRPGDLPVATFDCFVLTQTLQFIYDVEAAIAGAHAVLRPGGTLLATVPAVSRIDRNAGPSDDYWRFTEASVTRLFTPVFGADVAVSSYGNVLTAVAFLMGMAADELKADELHYTDSFFPVLIGVRAAKRA